MEVGDDVAVKEEAHREDAPATEPPKAEPERREAPASVDDSMVLTTHAVRLLAKRMNVNLTQVKGSGKRGRVTKEDVILFAESGGKPAKAAAKKPVKTEAPTAGKADKVVKLTDARRAMVKAMTDGLSIPHESVQEEISFAKLDKVCKGFVKDGSLQYVSFVVKAVSCALAQYPVLNTHATETRDNEGILVDYVEKADHNVSIALDTPSGLLTPSIKAVQTKSIMQINEEILQLMDKAKNATLTDSDLSDGTITVSSMRELGGIVAAPLIFRPQVASIFIGRGRLMPEFGKVKGATKVLPVEVSNVCVSADRRIVEPAVVTRFVNLIKQYIEELDMLLLNLK
eukprot:TRINITY_DN8838_c0_g1_i1.p1 TRINITY_DN8838_c0_g1~~TRINITY_DN8838_c0_g1_i1.p1  ORF type:complete len:342 (-),score=101.32 TRINITY_DN8838_c0_g1_i1:114-1139(-)